MNQPHVEHLAWLDLETTGADEGVDEIIEIGVVLTDLALNVADEMDAVIRPTPAALSRLMANDVIREMHSANGLLEDCQAPEAFSSADHADIDVVSWLKGHGVKSHAVAIAGSGVGHFDRRFIKAHMPGLDKFCAFWMLDVGNLRRGFRFATGDDLAPEINAAKPHRSLDDVKLHVEEAREFWHLFRAAQATANGDPAQPYQAAATLRTALH